MYDIAIIGAGINGCSVAYEFAKEGKKVVVFDMEGIAHGGSGAAGAFISPKFSKSGELKEIIGDAFIYSMSYYEENFPHLITRSALLHIAKDELDSQTLRAYKKESDLELLKVSIQRLNSLHTQVRDKESVSVNAGVVNAVSVCKAMLKSTDFIKQKVNTLIYDEKMWIINESYSAKNIIIATGAYEGVIEEPYIKLRGVWGHRIDIHTTTQNPDSIHQFVSISPSEDGVLAIGATHNLGYHPQKSTKPYDVEAGRKELLEKALRTLHLENVKVIKDYMGLRSGSFDYMPLLGRVVLSRETLRDKSIRFKVKKADYTKYQYYPNLYMINGNGGYGFVLAPYLAKILKEHIINGKIISSRISPARFFARWAKKL